MPGCSGMASVKIFLDNLNDYLVMYCNKKEGTYFDSRIFLLAHKINSSLVWFYREKKMHKAVSGLRTTVSSLDDVY